jgi:hypothetical protein
MAKGQPSKVTQTNKVELTPEQRELMQKGMGQIDQTFANGTPQLPSVQGFDPLQTSAQEGVIGKNAASQEMAGNLAGAQNFLTGDVMDLSKNPALQRAMEAAMRPITENFQNVVMPGMRTEAVSAGALGSPKGNQRAQTASDQYLRQIGDTSAGFLNTAYGQNLDALVKGVALAPQSQQAFLFPEMAMEGVGAQRRQLAQQQGAQGFNQTMLPFQLGTQLISAAAGAPGAGSTSTVTGAQPQQSWTQMLGAGLSAASLLAGFA